MNSFIRMTWFHMRNLWSTFFFLETVILTPLSFLFMKLISANWHITYSIVADSIISGIWASTILSVGIIGFQKFQETLQYQAISPLPSWKVFAPLVSAASLIGILSFPLVFVAIAIICFVSGQAYPVPSLSFVVGSLLVLLSCCASAFIMASLFVLTRHALIYEPLILTPIWMLSGLIYPVTDFPRPLQIVAFTHPLTSAVWISQQQNFSQFTLLAVAHCLILSLGFIAISRRMLSYALHKAIVEGTLNLS